MTITVSPIYLLNAVTSEPETAELWDGITEKQLSDWEGEWLPELFKSVQIAEGDMVKEADFMAAVARCKAENLVFGVVREQVPDGRAITEEEDRELLARLRQVKGF
jgi:hypothetical protein